MLFAQFGSIDPFSINIPSPRRIGSYIGTPAKAAPFFTLDTEDGVVSSFMKAVSDGAGDEWRFLSRRATGNIDLNELRAELAAADYKCLIPHESPALKQSAVKTRALLIIGREKGEKSVLLLRVVREPDRFGQWKILRVEKE